MSGLHSSRNLPFMGILEYRTATIACVKSNSYHNAVEKYHMPSLSITYSMECTSQLEDTGEFASVYKGEVFSFDHNSDEEVKVGCVQFTLINVYHAIDEWGDIHEALDLEARLYNYSCLFSDHNEFSDCIADAGMDLEELQVLIVDHICLKEEFRGLGVTQQIISDAERRFAHNRGLTVLMCVPLQFTNFTDDPYIAEQVSSFNENFETSQYKLECFYRTIGFRPIVPDPEDSNSAYFMARPSSVDYYKVLSDDTENKNL